MAAAPHNEVVHVDPEIMSGESCFAGTRVLVRNLIEYLAGGESLDKFLDLFPTVTREQATPCWSWLASCWCRVRILLDESVPHDLVAPLAEHHEVETAQGRGWGGTRNGDLLRLIDEEGFDAFITCDQKLPYQQNLRGSPSGSLCWPRATTARRRCWTYCRTSWRAFARSSPEPSFAFQKGRG